MLTHNRDDTKRKLTIAQPLLAVVFGEHSRRVLVLEGRGNVVGVAVGASRHLVRALEQARADVAVVCSAVTALGENEKEQRGTGEKGHQ